MKSSPRKSLFAASTLNFRMTRMSLFRTRRMRESFVVTRKRVESASKTTRVTFRPSRCCPLRLRHATMMRRFKSCVHTATSPFFSPAAMSRSALHASAVISSPHSTSCSTARVVMSQRRSLRSRPPLTKWRSFHGQNATPVTGRACSKRKRHARERRGLYRQTLPSSDALSKKSPLRDHESATTGFVWSAKSASANLSSGGGGEAAYAASAYGGGRSCTATMPARPALPPTASKSPPRFHAIAHTAHGGVGAGGADAHVAADATVSFSVASTRSVAVENDGDCTAPCVMRGWRFTFNFAILLITFIWKYHLGKKLEKRKKSEHQWRRVARRCRVWVGDAIRDHTNTRPLRFSECVFPLTLHCEIP